MGITARKGPISATNHQWGMKKTPTDGRFTLLYLGQWKATVSLNTFTYEIGESNK
ncbi:hypothetical protein [Niallia sp. 03133]|uniref:hypothetical protein n=1 Tax=Niallia sp. 03133 TaxID=3458060 RepID=UPI004044C479